MARRVIPALLSLILAAVSLAQPASPPASRLARVDDAGVLRWTDDSSEVALFGVNYYPPFSMDYQLIQRRGLDHKAIIREDVEHFARLGLTAIRLHCWDREISDHQGNLLDNDHLDLLDYLIARCAERGIYSVMTPIAWWGSPTGGGFSDLYSMHRMTTDPQAWAIQANYLQQYVNHVNRYTGKAYKDDPAVICFELINEPIYPSGTTDEQIITYVNTLVDAIHETGCTKPIFHSFFCSREAAVAKSRADGITFGWYPTGLVAGHMLTGDYLPRVNDFASMREPALDGKAKIIYEFDPADVQKPYMYPAMARAFRSGGAQIATQFQYDPMRLADANANWQTHYLNLCYTPNKAVSFAIAAEVFRRIPRLSRFGNYPDSNRFGDFRVNFQEALAELVTDTDFMYSNDTVSRPPAPEKLTRVWGCGSSSVVRYSGLGAYFLDREADGRWRLELYPDAVMVEDPYRGGTSEKVRILWAQQDLALSLPDLGDAFGVSSVSEPGAFTRAEGGKVSLLPGRYVLTRDGVEVTVAAASPLIAPESSDAPPAAFVAWPAVWREGYPLTVTTSVAAPATDRCVLEYRIGDQVAFTQAPMAAAKPYTYIAALPAQALTPGELQTRIRVETPEGTYVLPGGKRLTGQEPATPPEPATVLAIGSETVLPEATYGGPEGNSAKASFVPGRGEGEMALRLEATGFGEPPSCTGIRVPAAQLPQDLTPYDAVTFLARGGPDTRQAEITLVQDDGNAFGYNVPLSEAWSEFTVPLSRLRSMWATKTGAPDISRVKEVSVIYGAWILSDVRDRAHWVEVQSVRLTSAPETWETQVASREAPISLVRPAEHPVHPQGIEASAAVVMGMGLLDRALRVGVKAFGPEPSCVSYRVAVDEGASLWAEELARANTVVVTVRAGTAGTDRLELVLMEDDGAPWGITLNDIGPEWQQIRIPLDQLRFFGHWNPVCQGRGGEGDHLRPERVHQVNFCFGAFLFPDSYAQPHALEVQEVALARE